MGMAESAPRAITHRRVLAIALPVVISNATIPILGLVDTGVVGQIGDPVPIGAVSVGAIILTAIYWVFGFLRMGTVGFAAQARGAGDGDEVSAILSRALLIAAAAGAGLIALQVPLFWAAFQLSPASPEVEALARDYMQIRVFSAPAAIAVYGLTGWLIAAERTRAVLAVQLWMNGLNILLDLVFVLGLDMGVSGVASATFLAEWSGAALGLWLCRDAFARPAWRARAKVLDPGRLRRMAAVNTDILLRSVMLEAIFVSFVFYGASFGDVELAANQVLIQFLFITAYGLDGFAFAAESLVGQAIGARDRAALRRGAGLTSLWGLGCVSLLALAFWAGGAPLIDVLSAAPQVREAAREFLPWMVAGPLLGVASWMFDGIYIGATRSRDMRNLMALSALGYVLALWALLPVWGNHGLWAALMMSFVLRGVLMALRYPALERAVLDEPRA